MLQFIALGVMINVAAQFLRAGARYLCSASSQIHVLRARRLSILPLNLKLQFCILVDFQIGNGNRSSRNLGATLLFRQAMLSISSRRRMR